MNPSLIDRLEIQSESSVRHSAYNHKSGKKQRATAKYWKNETARSRRKGENTRIRQQRREEIRLEYQPSEDDIYLENIHFADFLGCKDGTVRYNTPNNHQDNVCLSECDDILCLRVKESEPSEPELEQESQDEDEDEDEEYPVFISEFASQFCDYSIPEEDRQYYMQLIYFVKKKTLSGETVFAHKDEQINRTNVWVMSESNNYQ